MPSEVNITTAPSIINLESEDGFKVTKQIGGNESCLEAENDYAKKIEFEINDMCWKSDMKIVSMDFY